MPLLRNVGLLRPLLAVARAGNLSTAARELAVSQPALTKSVRKLEQHVGVALFDRRARGMALTPSGTALLAHARLIETQCRFADAEIAAIAHGEAGAIRIGAGPYWGPSLVPLAVARLHARFPKLRVDLEVGVTTSLHAVMRFLKAGPYLACLADSYVRAMPEPDVGILPFRHEIWSFPSGALYHASLRSFTPVSALIDALRELFPDQRRHTRP